MSQTLFVIEVRDYRTGRWSPAVRLRSRAEAEDLLSRVVVQTPTRIVETQEKTNAT